MYREITTPVLSPLVAFHPPPPSPSALSPPSFALVIILLLSQSLRSGFLFVCGLIPSPFHPALIFIISFLCCRAVFGREL